MSAAADLLSGFRSYLSGRDDAGLQEFAADFDWAMTERSLAPSDLAVVDCLRSAVPPRASGEAALVGQLAEVSGGLRWGQTYGSSDFGDAFLARYGWVELFGTRGHFDSRAMAGGFLLLGPDVHYPDHHHVAEEIYIPLTPGSYWSKGGSYFVPREVGEIIHHPSDIRHAMRTGEQPLVALYLWRGGPLDQKSIISGSPA
jgi:hypothetical protein